MTTQRFAFCGRVSTEDKGQDPETQLRPLREYAERRGFLVAGEFVDRASGTTEQRPQYQKLLEAARKRELDVVLVWRYDRFARSTRALVNALARISHGGVLAKVDPVAEACLRVVGGRSWAMAVMLGPSSPVAAGERLRAAYARSFRRWPGRAEDGPARTPAGRGKPRPWRA